MVQRQHQCDSAEATLSITTIAPAMQLRSFVSTASCPSYFERHHAIPPGDASPKIIAVVDFLRGGWVRRARLLGRLNEPPRVGILGSMKSDSRKHQSTAQHLQHQHTPASLSVLTLPTFYSSTFQSNFYHPNPQPTPPAKMFSLTALALTLALTTLTSARPSHFSNSTIPDPIFPESECSTLYSTSSWEYTTVIPHIATTTIWSTSTSTASYTTTYPTLVVNTRAVTSSTTSCITTSYPITVWVTTEIETVVPVVSSESCTETSYVTDIAKTAIVTSVPSVTSCTEFETVCSTTSTVIATTTCTPCDPPVVPTSPPRPHAIRY
ncbi:hypothetical protein EJ06DRAFT_551821 [Trichodelitschia bisporula]|uniref:Uncharacterized protein n=1 Tax=Trichodelitschia bisporula TaxID=703511 RepID=A0A6G1HJ55_9PEZI|nr:hypothetical protein EJ06DRAFT_551821 [Trichodelitschia bisporula]